MRFPQLIALCAALAATSACGPKYGAYNDDTGLRGIQVPKGSLAGTWGEVVEFDTIVPVPILGDREGGGRNTRLVTITWNKTDQKYDETFTRCTNEVFTVENTMTIVRPETLAKIEPCSYRSVPDHAQGAYRSETVVELWGVRDLPDPENTPLPTKDNFKTSPQSDWMWDEDDDGHPGVTIEMRGLIVADLYVCKRSVYVFDGTIVSKDHVMGLIRPSQAESNSVAASVDWIRGEGSSKPNPDPLRTWFDMTRLTDGAGCDDLAQAVSDGRLSMTRPF